MAYLIGLVLAFGIFGFGRWTGLDRERAFYATLAVVVASYYVLFAVIGGSTHSLVVESIAMLAFVVVAVMGFKFNPWLVVAALAGHGLFDAVHDLLVTNPGVPEWWPAFCGTFDVVVAVLLALTVAPLRASQAGPK